LTLWKIISETDVVLIPNNRGKIFSTRFLHSEFLSGGLSRYVATSLIVGLSPGHSDINRFPPSSPIATGNHLDRAEKITKFAQTAGIFEVYDPRSGISGPISRRALASTNLYE
jgi:hypothetical protein